MTTAGSAQQTMTMDQALQQAIAHHQAGRLPEAEQLYRAILQVQPDHSDANHNLGVLAGQVGKHKAGIPYLKTALLINPARWQYLQSYTEALLATDQAREALGTIQKAMQSGFNTAAAQSLRQKIETAVGVEQVGDRLEMFDRTTQPHTDSGGAIQRWPREIGQQDK